MITAIIAMQVPLKIENNGGCKPAFNINTLSVSARRLKTSLNRCEISSESEKK